MTGCPFHQAIAAEHRADPYPFYAALPAQPSELEDGRFVVAAYDQVLALLHDSRLSSAGKPDGAAHPDPERRLSLLALDPPEHDRLRRIMMRQFGPPHRPRLVHDLEPEIARVTDALIDDLAGRDEADLVATFAHKLPVAMICRLFGIPASDETRFHHWVATITRESGAGQRSPEAIEAGRALGRFLTEIAESRRGQGGDDVLSGFVDDEGAEGKLPVESIAPMATLLLIAGHETTVNLIANGILALLRAPEERARLAAEPGREIGLVEELLRYEPPVQFIQNRWTLAEIEVGGVTIPKHRQVVLALAAANRDPHRFAAPDTFDSARRDIQHLGFGSGVHACFGAPLARLEGQIALRRLFERLDNPRLVSDPPYRPSPLLRGPAALMVAYDGVRPAAG